MAFKLLMTERIFKILPMTLIFRQQNYVVKPEDCAVAQKNGTDSVSSCANFLQLLLVVYTSGLVFVMLFTC